MISPYWSNEETVVDAVKDAKERGVKFYASYSYNEGDHGHPGDVSKTITFVTEKLAELLDAKPWHLPAVYGHDSAVWDVATFDGNGNGRADIWETILEEKNTVTTKEILEESGDKPQNSTEKLNQASVAESKLTNALLGAITTGILAGIKKMSVNSKFSSDITYDTTTITETTEGNRYIRECDVSVPSTMDTQNQPKDIIIFLNGYDKNGNPKKLLDIINGSELEKPNAIIIEPRNLSTSNSSIWTSKYAVKELQAILEEVYEDYGLLNEDGSLREDVTYTIIRI